MTIYSVYDSKFRRYGKILENYDTAELVAKMKSIPMPEEGLSYEAGIDCLESCAVFNDFQQRAFGDIPIELGMCWGHNRKLNCLEYHKGSELNIGAYDYILLLAAVQDIENGKLDTSKVEAFHLPAGLVIQVYETTLHYAPCHVNEPGFCIGVVLPYGTNAPLEPIDIKNVEDKLLRAKNKWLLVHPDAPESMDGAYIGLTGDNIELP